MNKIDKEKLKWDLNNKSKKYTTYNIVLEDKDNLEPFEIAECFKEQYPGIQATITYSKIIKMQMGVILVGVNLGNLFVKGGVSAQK